jgi:hypothetical protein
MRQPKCIQSNFVSLFGSSKQANTTSHKEHNLNKTAPLKSVEYDENSTSARV